MIDCSLNSLTGLMNQSFLCTKGKRWFCWHWPVPVDERLPSGGALISRQHLERGGLPGSVHTQQSKALPGPDAQTQPVHCQDTTHLPGFIHLGEIHGTYTLKEHTTVLLSYNSQTTNHVVFVLLCLFSLKIRQTTSTGPYDTCAQNSIFERKTILTSEHFCAVCTTRVWWARGREEWKLALHCRGAFGSLCWAGSEERVPTPLSPGPAEPQCCTRVWFHTCRYCSVHLYHVHGRWFECTFLE